MAQWYESHNAPGSTSTGTRWALAEGEVGGASGAQTYILIANTSAFAGQARVTVLLENGGEATHIYTCERTAARTCRSATISRRPRTRASAR